MSSRCHPLLQRGPLLALVGSIACNTAERDRDAPAPSRAAWGVPARDTTGACADVGALRVCWDGTGAPVSAVPAPLPPAEVSALGHRCTGLGAERRCRDRAEDAPPFACEEGRCVQRHPRLPDDGEWECADVAGAAVCRGGEPAAGAAPGGADPSWVCGPRRGGDAGARERICVDLSPDLPDRTGKYRCRFEVEGGRRRVCERDPAVHLLGDACDAARPCVDGSRCVAGRCVPPAPEPSCWLDRDCPSGRCRFGSCAEDG